MKAVHWSESRERASYWGIAFLVRVLRVTGPGFVKVLAVVVALYYFVSSGGARRSSGEYMRRLQLAGAAAGRRVELPWGVPGWREFRHIASFARSIVERVHAWSAGCEAFRYEGEGLRLLEATLRDEPGGALFLVSHLGNFDLSIARSQVIHYKNFNVVMNTRHARVYNRFRAKIFKSERVRFVEAQAITPIEVMGLCERVGDGEVVVMAADRTAKVGGEHNVVVRFLGGRAEFPGGPYIMAHILGVPVYCLFVVKQGGRCLVRFDLFEKRVVVPRVERRRALEQYAQKYADRLARECLDFPLQWYNFYDFWVNSTETQAGEEKAGREVSD